MSKKLIRRNLAPKFQQEGKEVLASGNLTADLLAKLQEEVAEAVAAADGESLLDELGDIYEVLCVLERVVRKDYPVFKEFIGFVERSIVKRHHLGSFDQGFLVDA